MTYRSIIGVDCIAGEEPWVGEFFELFKTPWEFYREDRTYPVIVATHGRVRDVKSKLLVLYGSKAAEDEVETAVCENTHLDYEGALLPIYGKVLTFKSAALPLVRVHGTSAAAVVEVPRSGTRVLRVGYDVFHEVRRLLSSGQPAHNALTPTLELHISMLRDWILAAGIPLVEIPASPSGYEFIACLTHDVDFIRIRDHKLDHTTWGFLYRASLGSLVSLAKQKLSLRNCLRNLKALVSLPAVHLGICKDFWLQDFERFVSLERDLKATFFFIPFKNRPGDKVPRSHANRRAALYDVTEEKNLIEKLAGLGNEIGVHGIDAWHDAEKGRQEHRRIAQTTGKSDLGIRVHWLCFDGASPRILDEAGFQYDSTFGYNETVGYRAGTSQVFRPEGAQTLLELPLHIQDTALFYSGYLGLAQGRAWNLCETLLKNASAYGGVVTILWHTRSLAPERLWGDFYHRLLQALRARPVWFATAGQVVEWFRKRRALSFGRVEFSERTVRLAIEHPKGLARHDDDPRPIVRIHTARRRPVADPRRGQCFIDIPWTGEPVMEIAVD